jgi:tRNA-splicing ligase RtcB (3'-phosphate/5'-hydroxy nucleic acid ligase)
MRVIYDESKMRIPVKLWLEDIEDGAMAQIMNLANLPFAFRHIAVMPDSHQGYGMPIGGVLATQGVVIPNAVGVDIGCGMCAVKTSIKGITIEQIKAIMSKIREAVPVGFNHHKDKQDESLMPLSFNEVKELKVTIIERQYESALRQIGTLGGGNHFIELQKDGDGFMWMMVHSGSRNFGKQVADYYNDIAEDLNEKYFSIVDKKQELAFLPIASAEGIAYLTEMNFCVDFALANRKLMMENIKACIYNVIKNVSFDEMINIAHNYATMEHHFDKDVMIHRKGATLARKGMIGIIPGSQGTKSYIVRGLGNPESFESCSHGAGRKMGRKQAIKNLNLDEEIKRMNEQGIVHGLRTIQDLDEAAGAYKDIDVVMNNQKDLVEVLVELTPLAVIKG